MNHRSNEPGPDKLGVWGYELRGDFEPIKSCSSEVRDWIASLPSKHKEMLCDIIRAIRSSK
jgi:hypothetical protein